jgi:hypothetical protein
LRKLHNEGLHNFCSSQNIIRVIKSRRMRWERPEAGNEELENAYRIAVGS